MRGAEIRDLGTAKQTKEGRGREIVSVMEEAASTTDGLGSADPSCTVVHSVRFFLILLGQPTTRILLPLKRGPKTNVFFLALQQ